VNTFDNLSFFKFLFGHSANAVGSKVCVPGLDASKTAQILIPLLLPLCDQVCVSVLLFDAKVVQFSGNGFSPVEKVEDVTRFLVMNFENWPQGFHFSLALV